MLTHECKGNASYKHLSIKQENIDLYYKNKPRIFATVPINVVKAQINGNYLSDITVDMKSSIESHDPNRKPKPYQEVVNFMVSHGLSNDSKLLLLAERLKTDGRISGIEKYEVTYCSEIANALKIAASIDYKMFSDNLDFSVEHNHVHIIKKSLEINFG